MKRPLLLLPAGLLAAALAFGSVYWWNTRRQRALENSSQAELAWLRQTFHLTDAQFESVAALHAAYRPACLEHCQDVAEKNVRLEEAILANHEITPDLQRLIEETGRARDACRQAMLIHLYAVAREMPPDDARRYLAMMLHATCVLEEAHPSEGHREQ